MIEKGLSKRCSSTGIYMRSISDIPTERKDIRNSYILSIWSNIRSTSHMNELSEMPSPAEGFKNSAIKYVE